MKSTLLVLAVLLTLLTAPRIPELYGMIATVDPLSIIGESVLALFAATITTGILMLLACWGGYHLLKRISNTETPVIRALDTVTQMPRITTTAKEQDHGHAFQRAA